MMARVGAAASTVVAAAAAALAADKGATVVQPTVWHFAGYAYEVGPMAAGLAACFAVRFYVIRKDYPTHRWSLDIPISLLTLMFTAAAIMRLRPDPIMALVYGTGLGVLGAGIIALAKKHVDRMLAALGLSEDPAKP